jgi:ATP-dependent Clp protease ATP-binding subunit ClpC
MTTRIARFLTSLYPRRWRERYEQEFLHFLQDHPLSVSAVLNVIGSALCQRFLAFGHRGGIFSDYTQRARRAVFFARYEASQLGSNSIEPEHLLLGVLRENNDDLISGLFADSSTIQRVIQDARAGLTVVEKKILSTNLPLSSACKRILAHAHEEAIRLEEATCLEEATRLNDRIGLAHLLIGILREEESNACEILTKHGLQLDGARETLVRLSMKKR